ncbi:MAG: GNAT family N-acetyltransferase [Myxococcota bacterium]
MAFRTAPPPSSTELRRLAHLHAATLPGSILGNMGANTLVRYYAWVLNSGTEELFVAGREEGIWGAAVVSMDPGSVTNRFVGSSPLRFGSELTRALAHRPVLRRQVLAFAREKLSAPSADASLPELMQIFVDGSRAGRSIGSELLSRVEESLRQQRVAEYCVRTLRDNNAATLNFYRRRGFVEFDAREFCGDGYVFLRKGLASKPAEQN